MTKRGKTPLHRRAAKIAKLEGRKVQVSMGNILEVLAREEDLMAEDFAKRAFKLGETRFKLGGHHVPPMARGLSGAIEKKGNKLLSKMRAKKGMKK